MNFGDQDVVRTSSGERLEVRTVASSEQSWPWGGHGPSLLTTEDYRTGRRAAYLLVGARRVRIPWRLAQRWRPWLR